MRKLVAETCMLADVRPLESLVVGILLGMLAICTLGIVDAYLPATATLTRALFG